MALSLTQGIERDGDSVAEARPARLLLHQARATIGSLLTCPFRVGPWVATALTGSMLFAPRATRLAASVFSMVAISDFLHQAYAAARNWSREPNAREG